jgi:hypothetical protein
MGILRLKNGLVFELIPELAAFYLGPIPINFAFLFKNLVFDDLDLSLLWPI